MFSAKFLLVVLVSAVMEIAIMADKPKGKDHSDEKHKLPAECEKSGEHHQFLVTIHTKALFPGKNYSDCANKPATENTTSPAHAYAIAIEQALSHKHPGKPRRSRRSETPKAGAVNAGNVTVNETKAKNQWSNAFKNKEKRPYSQPKVHQIRDEKGALVIELITDSSHTDKCLETLFNQQFERRNHTLHLGLFLHKNATVSIPVDKVAVSQGETGKTLEPCVPRKKPTPKGGAENKEHSKEDN